MLAERKSACCGCSACEQICPTGAVSMEEDEEGFVYPKINDTMCIHCNKCDTICAFSKKLYQKNELNEPDAYALKHKNLAIRLNSRSGGCFTALSDYILHLGGIIYGCGYGQDFEVVHKRAENKEERDEFRGSKYVQSNTEGIFEKVRNDLKEGKYVLFSGTSCQVAGLKGFLGKTPQETLYCVDILCHGVPSPMVWRDYLIFMKKRYHGMVTEVDFRNKKQFGWKKHIETIRIGGNSHNSTIYKELFYSHYILRPSCYECPYKQMTHPADITLADFWGIQKAVKNFNDNKGVSLVLINSVKGRKLFEQVKEDTIYEKCKVRPEFQRPLHQAFPMPEDRMEFWKSYRRKGFYQIAIDYGGLSRKKYWKEQISYCKKKLKKWL